MKGYIKSVRPLASVFPSLLILASFKLSGGSLNQAWLLTIAMIVNYWAVMAQNDLRDRWHDSKKGKTFALENVTKFKWFVASLWIVGIGLSSIACYHHLSYIWLFGFTILGGLIYSELRAVPMASNSLVALMVGSVALFPLFTDHLWAIPSLWLFVAVSLAMFAREILKDFDDREIDPGYKWTFIQRFGERRSLLVIAACLASGGGALLFVNIMALPIVLLLMPFRPSLIELEYASRTGDVSPTVIGRIKLLMDIGLAILMFLYIFGLASGTPIPGLDKASLLIVCLVIAFFIGSIPFSWIAVWLFCPRDEEGKRQDLRLLGSGNVGATNAMRQLNLSWYIRLIFFDASKAIIAMLVLGRFFPGDEVIRLCFGLLATVGHCFPIYLGFERGKGISCTAGVLAFSGLPILLFFFAGVWLSVVTLTKKAKPKLDQRVWIASVAAAASMPLFAWFLTGSEAITSLLATQSILVIACHADHFPGLCKRIPSFDPMDILEWASDRIWGKTA